MHPLSLRHYQLAAQVLLHILAFISKSRDLRESLDSIGHILRLSNISMTAVTLGGLSRCFLSKQRLITLLSMTALPVHIQRCYNVSFLGQGPLKNHSVQNNGINKALI